MTKRGWIVLGIVGAMCTMLLMTGIGVCGYLLFQHKKSAHVQATASTGIDTVDHSKDQGKWELDSSYDTTTKSMLRWYSVKDIQGQYDITIFNNGIIQLTRLDMNAPAFTCPTEGEDTCSFTVLFDNKPTELWSVNLINDGAGGAATIVENEAFLRPLAMSDNTVIVVGTVLGNKNIVFDTHGCPVAVPSSTSL